MGNVWVATQRVHILHGTARCSEEPHISKVWVQPEMSPTWTNKVLSGSNGVTSLVHDNCGHQYIEISLILVMSRAVPTPQRARGGSANASDM